MRTLLPGKRRGPPLAMKQGLPHLFPKSVVLVSGAVHIVFNRGSNSKEIQSDKDNIALALLAVEWKY